MHRVADLPGLWVVVLMIAQQGLLTTELPFQPLNLDHLTTLKLTTLDNNLKQQQIYRSNS